MHIVSMTPEDFMKRYKYIFVDEVHKYDQPTDLTLKELSVFFEKHGDNPECPILIMMSGTLNPEELAEYFNISLKTQYIEVEGSKGFPITEHWPENSISDIGQEIVKIVEANINKDILIFLPTGASMKNIKMKLSQFDVFEAIYLNQNHPLHNYY